MANQSLKNLSPTHRKSVVNEVLTFLRSKYGAQIGHIEITQQELDSLAHIEQATKEELDRAMTHLGY